MFSTNFTSHHSGLIFFNFRKMRTPTRKSSFPRIALRGKSLLVKHQSLAHDNLRRKASQMKAKEIEEAVQWCKDNNKRGWGDLT